MPKVPDLKIPRYDSKKVRDKKIEKVKATTRFAYSQEDKELKQRLKILNERILLLKIEQRGVVEAIKKREMLRRQENLQPVSLYALRLSDGCWYIGMSHNVEKRFKRHLKGKGAYWTKLHEPIEIAEVRETNLYNQDAAAKLEDDMTLEYALKYGTQYVRGGGYCQAKPHWPSGLREPDLTWIK